MSTPRLNELVTRLSAADNPVDAVAAMRPREVAALRATVAILNAAAKGWAEIEQALASGACPTCEGPTRETVGMVCQTCGTDYGIPDPHAFKPGQDGSPAHYAGTCAHLTGHGYCAEHRDAAVHQ